MNEAETHTMSIDQIEGVSTQFPSFDSGLACTLYRARTKNIKDLDAYELKVALENKVGLNFLIPVALQMLRSDVFSDGGVYEGALMQCILGLPKCGLTAILCLKCRT